MHLFFTISCLAKRGSVCWHKSSICSGDFIAVQRQQAVHISLATVRYEDGSIKQTIYFVRKKSLKEYRIKDVDIHKFLHFIMEDGGKLPADFEMLQKNGNYLIHVDGEKAFCLNEREAYLKDSMENLMARSLPYFSDMRVSFSVHIKDKTGKADIAVLDNRRLSKEIAKKQVKGKSLTIRYRSGKSQSSRLSTEQYIRGSFGEKVGCICYSYFADTLIRMRQDMFSGRGDFQSFVYQAENERSLSATVREVHAIREKTFETASMEQFRRDWNELQFLRMMDQYNYQKGRPDSERLNSFRQEIKQAVKCYTGYIQIPSFLSVMERESFQYLYKAGAQEHMAVAEKASYYPERDR